MSRDRMQTVCRRWALAVVGVLVATLSPDWAVAQSPLDVRLLTPREHRQLGDEARKIYDEAVNELDHINPIKAIDLFDRAAKLEPNAVELQFLTARLAYLRARRVPREEAATYYEIAEGALNRIAKQENLSPLVRRRYETQMKQIADESKSLEVRKQRRLSIGLAFRKIYAKEAYPDEDKEGKEEKKTVTRPGAQGQTARPQGPTARPPAPRPQPRRGSDSAS